jgi:cephalosporin hydroxylase
LKPDVIIETGTANGGGALYLASICELIGRGKIVSIDIEKQKNMPEHKRVTYLIGSSISEDIINKVRSMIGRDDRVMVILDSAHEKDHVLKELIAYSKFVTKNSYIIAEDTNINGNPIMPDFGEGPMEAVREFLKNNDSFTVDKSKEKFYLSFNPGGYLKKVGP